MYRRLQKLLLFFMEPQGRLWTLGILFISVFGIIIGRFYKLQIADYETYKKDVQMNTQRQMTVLAERGEIYDRYGYPLAINEAIQSIYYTSNIDLDDTTLNTHLLKLIDLLEKNGDTFVDEVPISLEAPFVYTGSIPLIHQFTYNIPYENEAHRKILCTYTAEEMIDYLKHTFNIAETLSETTARKLIALRCEVYSCKYRQYEEVLLAENISMKTAGYLEENNTVFPNLIVEMTEKRVYPLGCMASNILGYTRTINNEQYMTLKDESYDIKEEIGQMGIEKTLQDDLRGQNGSVTIEIDNMGQRMETLKEVEAQKGKDIYLTIDAKLQQDVYEAVERRLGEALVTKLKDSKTYKMTGEDLLCSLITCHAIDFESDMPYTIALNHQLEAAYLKIDPLMQEKISFETLLKEWIVEKQDTAIINKVLLVLDEQEVLVLDQKVIKQINQNQKVDLNTVFIKALESGDLTAGQMSLDPFSAVAIMVDVNSGEVLSMVDYPSYDNNEMSTHFNYYFNRICEDERSLLWQRSLKTLKAPGSTFKMMTALAGLKEGCITPETVIDDVGVYKEAGKPYPKCWYYTSYGKGHGKLNLEEAIAASCNYYFYEVAHRLAEKEGNTSMSTLSHYMTLFGLTEKTGIELDEKSPSASMPDIVVENELSEILGELCAYDEVQIEKLASEGKIDLTKQIILTDNEMTNTVYKTYALALQDNLEPLVQEVLKDKYALLLQNAYKELVTYVKVHEDVLFTKMNQEILAETDVSKREEKAYEVFNRFFNEVLSETINEQIEDALLQISHNAFLDAYEKAMQNAYRKGIREEGQEKVCEDLQKHMQYLDSQETAYRQEILLKVRQNLLNTIVNNLLNGVELNWTEGIVVRTAIGQGYNAFSPLQVVRYVAALANGHEIRPLTLIRQDMQCEGKALDISPNDIQAVQKGMLAATTYDAGTAKGQFDNLPFKVAVKTGTAQEENHEHSYIVAFAPYEKPEVALIVAIYNADGLGGYSTLLANDMLLSYFGLENEQEGMTLGNTWME